jgi:hypothetical protein
LLLAAAMRTRLPLLALLASIAAGCSDDGAGADDFLDCAAEKCDSVGPLTVSRRWIPVDGFIRVTLAEGHTLSVEPAAGARVTSNGNRHTVELAEAGYYSIAALRDGAAVATLPVRASDEGAAFTVTSPAAGSFAAIPPGTPVTVEGRVSDPLGRPLTIELGDAAVPVDGSGAFRATLPTVFGVNFVEITATDVAGNRFVHSHAFAVAPRFGGAETATRVAASEELLDLVTEKLSPLLPTLIDVPAQADPIADPLAHRIFFDGATLPGQDGNPGSIQVALDSHAGELRAVTTTAGDLIARAHVDNWVMSDTHIVATASDLFVDATVEFGAGGMSPDVTDLTVDFSNFDLAIGSIPGWIPGLLVEAAQGIIGRVLKGRIGPIVGDALGSVAGDFQLSLVGECIDLTTPFTLSYRLGGIFPAEGRLGIHLGAQARHAGAEGPGAPWRDEQAQAAPSAGQMGVGVGYNLLNQFLYELWHAGALKLTLDEGDLAAALPRVPALAGLDAVLDVTAELALPPVVEQGEGGKVRVSFGELRVDLKLDVGVFQIALQTNVGARADLELTIEDGGVRVVPEVKELHFELGRRTFSGLNPEAVQSLVRAIAPEMVGRIAGALEAFRLPEFDLETAGLPGVRLGIESGTVTAGPAGVQFAGRVAVITGEPRPVAGPNCASPLPF